MNGKVTKILDPIGVVVGVASGALLGPCKTKRILSFRSQCSPIRAMVISEWVFQVVVTRSASLLLSCVNRQPAVDVVVGVD